MATNTLSDREWEVRLLFLEEVKDFLADIETEIIGLSDRGLQKSALDKSLRAAHSMKGGAGMMGFMALSELAHQLEDFFKILQTGNKKTTPEIESLFLSAIDNMGKTANIHKQRKTPDDDWLREFANPPFNHLRTILGELTAQDEASLLSEEAGEDMRVLMFSTEVDACLERLTIVLADQNSQVLREEFELTSQEFGCLGEMLELPAFSNLCAEISAALESKEHNLREVTTAALEAWRRSQALVLVSQFQALPEHFEVPIFLEPVAGTINSSSQIDSNVQVLDSSFWQEDQTTNLEKSATSLEEIQDLSLDNDISNDIPIDDTAKPEQNLDATIRVPLRQLETLSDRFGELNAERSGLRMQLKRMRDLVQLLNTRMHGLEQSNAQLRDAYDRVATSSEPFIPINAVMATETSTSIKGNIKGDRFTNQDPSSTTFLPYASPIEQARMRMLSEVLGRFPRLLRDLSLTHGKQVELIVRGSSTLVERSVLEVLEDPLLHLIRNAFDHGIETPESRIAQGKSPKGKIEIAAGYRGNQTVITFSDDGNGINFTKLRDRALQMGLSESDLDGSSESELLELIFEAGFSTADRVTELSGRGVGMDVVRSNLNVIGGSVRVETEFGQGTTFVLTVPVSLSIARVLLFESNGLQMAILTSAVEEILLIKDTSIYTVANQEVLDWQGYSVPLLKLGDRLHFSRPQFQVETENRPIVDEPLMLVVTRNNVPFGLQVDRYWGEQEVTIRGLQSPIPMPAGFMGCAILGGGKLVPLVDIDSLLTWSIADIDAPPSKTLTLPSERGDRRATVLIVDDSINVRRFLAMTLEKSGYRVEQAKDGLEAMEKLRKLQTLPKSSRVKAVICDIEMPRLDGFGFLVQSRGDENCKSIPVMMLTSRSGSKHRDLAMRLGASAYFAKPFKDNELLQTLSQFVAN